MNTHLLALPQAFWNRVQRVAHGLRRRFGWSALRFDDCRGRRIVFVPHCALNQNARVAGAAERRAGVDELVQGLLARDIGIVQMACPESELLGLDRAHVRIRDALQADECRYRMGELASEIADRIGQYRACGITVVGILGKNGSPTCGVEQTWEQGVVPGAGLFIERLRRELEARALFVNLTGYSDGEPERALHVIDRWLAETGRSRVAR